MTKCVKVPISLLHFRHIGEKLGRKLCPQLGDICILYNILNCTALALLQTEIDLAYPYIYILIHYHWLWQKEPLSHLSIRSWKSKGGAASTFILVAVWNNSFTTGRISGFPVKVVLCNMLCAICWWWKKSFLGLLFDNLPFYRGLDWH